MPSPAKSPPWALELIRRAQENPTLFVSVAIALALVVVLVSVTLVTISRGGIAESVAAMERGERRRFSSTLRAGLSNFWPVLGQGILFFLTWVLFCLVILALAALLFVGTFAATGSITALVLVVMLGVILLIPLFVGVAVPLFIISQFALRELVIGGEGVLDAIRDSYRIFRQSFGRSLVLLLIQIAITIGVGLILLIVTNLVGLLLSVLVAALSPASGFTAASVAVTVVLSLIFSIPFIVLSGALGTFYHAYWTLAYLRLTAGGAAGREA